MARTALVYVLPAWVIAVAWSRLESPRAVGETLWIVLLALIPAFPRRWNHRLAAAVVCGLLAAWIALDARPTDEGRLAHRLGDGFLEFYDVRVPFVPATHPTMHGVLLLAIFGFCLLLALAVAARRPFLAVLVTIAGAGWPATLLAGDSQLAVGATILVAALWILACLRAQTPRGLLPAAAAGGLLVAAAVAAASTAAVAKDGLWNWERWDPYDQPQKPVAVAYVWDAQYDGLRFPEQTTVVLRIAAPQRSLYWRATTLDVFASDRWFETLYPLTDPGFDGPFPRDPLVPDRPSRTWIRQEVEVAGLIDNHLVAAPTAVQIRARDVGPVTLLDGGVVRSSASLRKGQRYVVWSSVPEATPRELAASPPSYPKAVRPYLDVHPAVRMPPYGDPRLASFRRSLFTSDRTPQLWDYRPLAEAAERVTRGTSSPYAAVVALESWFRSSGGFRYEEQPPHAVGRPPLVDFVTRTKAGYCQHYAGAMALMLRYLGIPARVAVGFTSGTFDNGVWTVTDHDAHAWVEVWFRGHGWLSFDPTPGRGLLSTTYSTASDSAANLRGIEAVTGRGIDPTAGRPTFANRGRSSGDGRGFLRPLLVALAALLAGVGLVKLARRRLRYLTRDPRRRATAARRELAEFLRDQGLNATPRATAGELERLLNDELGVSGRAFAEAVGRARYGPPACIDDAARDSRRELRALLRVLRSRLSLVERASGWVALRSLRGA